MTTIAKLAEDLHMEPYALIAFALPIFEQYAAYANGLPDNAEVAPDDEAFIREAYSRA